MRPTEKRRRHRTPNFSPENRRPSARVASFEKFKNGATCSIFQKKKNKKKSEKLATYLAAWARTLSRLGPCPAVRHLSTTKIKKKKKISLLTRQRPSVQLFQANRLPPKRLDGSRDRVEKCARQVRPHLDKCCDSPRFRPITEKLTEPNRKFFFFFFSPEAPN